VLLVVVLLIAAVTPDEGVAAVKLSSAPAAAWGSGGRAPDCIDVESLMMVNRVPACIGTGGSYFSNFNWRA
jgi:hypothetical protein